MRCLRADKAEGNRLQGPSFEIWLNETDLVRRPHHREDMFSLHGPVATDAG
jgi:hypothetical protein